MSEHTKEPWFIDQYHNINTPDGQLGLGGVVTHCTRGPEMEEDRANARRIVACVNACADMSTEELENGLPGWHALLDRIENKVETIVSQRDKLLAALQEMVDCYWGTAEDESQVIAIERARAAIAKSNGE